MVKSGFISLQQLKFGLLSLLFLDLFFFLLVLLSPIYLYRWIVTKLKIILRPDLYKIIPAPSAIFLQHGIEKEERANVQITLKLQGKVSHEDLAAKITRVFLNSKSNGKLLFPEFKMFAEYWCGFPFWKLESNFRLEDHLRFEQIPKDSPKNFISKYEYDLIKIPFKYGKSPWKIVLLEGGNLESSYLIFKCHHSLGDGHAMFNILMKSVDNFVPVERPPKVQSQNESPNGILSNIFNCIQFPFSWAYEIVQYFHGISQTHPWTLPLDKMSPDSRVIVKCRDLISCKEIKTASVKHGVSFTTVLLSAIAGAIHNLFQRTKQNIPDTIGVGIPIPLSTGHPGTLRNEFGMMTPRLPVGESSKSARLEKCKIEMAMAVKSKSSISHIIYAKMVGALPHCIFSRLKGSANSAVQLTNFPGPSEAITLIGQPVQEMYFNIWCGNFVPIYLFVLSYNGGIQIAVNGDPGLFPSEELLHELMENIHQEISALVNEN